MLLNYWLGKMQYILLYGIQYLLCEVWRQHHLSPSFSYSSWYIGHIWWASSWLSVTPGWVLNISPKLKAAGRKTCQSCGVMQIWHHVCFRETETFLCFFLLLHSKMTCLVYRFRSVSIPILRSWSIELLIRLLNVINPAIPITIFIMRSLTQWHQFSLSFSSWSAFNFWDIWWAKVLVKIYGQSCWILKEKRKKSALKLIQPI